MSISHGIHCQPLLDLLFFCGGGGLVSNSLGCGPNGGGVLCLGVYRGGGVPTCSESDAWRAKVFLHSSGMLVQVATGSSPAFLAATVLGFEASLARVVFVKEVEWCLNLLKYFSILPVH